MVNVPTVDEKRSKGLLHGVDAIITNVPQSAEHEINDQKGALLPKAPFFVSLRLMSPRSRSAKAATRFTGFTSRYQPFPKENGYNGGMEIVPDGMPALVRWIAPASVPPNSAPPFDRSASPQLCSPRAL